MAKTHGQLRPKGVSGLLRIPVVEFVCRDGSARAAEQVVPLGRQRDVAKACELPGVEAAPRQKAHHRMLPDSLCQVHKAAAFGNAGQPRLQRGADAAAHGAIFAQLRGIELRIAAAEIEAVESGGQGAVRERRKRHELRADRPEQAEAVFIVKAERIVPRNTDAHRCAGRRKRRRHNVQRWRFARDGQQRVQIDRLFGLSGEALHFFAQICDLRRSHKAEMAAFQRAVRQIRQKAACLDAKAVFQHTRERRVGHRGAAVEDDAADAVVRQKVQKAAYRRQHRECRAARVHNEDHGRDRLLREFVGAGARTGQAEAVVIAHDALNDRDITAGGILREEEAKRIFVEEKRIEIRTFGPDDAAMEHRVNIIGAAFRGGD